MPTIVAIATAPINCAIHIIRVSGTKAYEIVNKITDTNVTKSSYTIQRANIVDKKKFVDDVLLMKFVSPKSFTGEDLIEINCHGGIYLANKIINLLIKNGAKLALPGDFSRRAFLNKKINLNQAEAINNLINTNSDIGIAVAHQGLSPHLNKQFKQITAELFQVLGKLEVSIDYPEYDDAKLSTNKLIIKKLIPLQQFLQKCIDVSTHSLKFLKGINLAIVGKPNVGKSSLLNALVNEDRAIISAIPGTTRDTIDASFKIDNLTFNVIDTAGIRLKTNDLIEKAGMSKTETIVKKADMIIWLIDGSRAFDNDDKKILKLLKNKKYLKVINKADKRQVIKDACIKISAKNHQIDDLLNNIKKEFKNIKVNDNDFILQSTNYIALVEHTIKLITQTINALKKNLTIDIQASVLHEAYENLLLITGEIVNFNFINEIFKKFCIGK